MHSFYNTYQLDFYFSVHSIHVSSYLDTKKFVYLFCNIALFLNILYNWIPAERILENDPQVLPIYLALYVNGMTFGAVTCHAGFDAWLIEIYGAKRHSVANSNRDSNSS